MSGLYANQTLQESLDRLGVVDRFPKIGRAGAENVLSLAVFTAETGHVQCTMALDLVTGTDGTIASTLLAVYPYHSADLAYADAMLVKHRLGVSLRRADSQRGWLFDPARENIRGPEPKVIVPPG